MFDDAAPKARAQVVSCKPDRKILAEMLQDCVAFNLRKSARIMTRRYDEALASSGLRSTQAAVLVALAAAGPMTMFRLADTLGMDASTLSRNFKLLEKRGLVSRTPKDGRTVNVDLTQLGLEALKKVSVCWNVAQADTLESTGETRWQETLATLRTLESAG